MYWKEITKEHHGRRVTVHADSTPTHPLAGEGPWFGVVSCENEDSISILRTLSTVMWIPGWYVVELLD